MSPVRPVPKLPLRIILLFALAGTAVAVGIAVADRSSNAAVLGGWVAQSPTQPGQPLPTEELDGPPEATGGGHDGRYFYAIARDLPDFHASAPFLDRPVYRDQRILYPLLARVLHPTGNGPGLIWTMFGVGVAGVLLLGVATGCLSVTLGAKPWPAFVLPVLFGSWVSLRISVPDPLAAGLGIGAVTLGLRGRWRWAIALAVAGVLTRETSLLLPLGFALWSRRREAFALVAVPVSVAGAWAAALRMMHLPPAATGDVVEFTTPFVGLVRSAQFAFNGNEPIGFLNVVAALVLAAFALSRGGLRHPLGWIVVLHLGLLSILTADVLAPERNGPRVVLALIAVSIITILTPRAAVDHGSRMGRADLSAQGAVDSLR